MENLKAIPVFSDVAKRVIEQKNKIVRSINDFPEEEKKQLFDKMPSDLKKKFDEEQRTILVLDLTDIVEIINVFHRAGYAKGKAEWAVVAC